MVAATACKTNGTGSGLLDDDGSSSPLVDALLRDQAAPLAGDALDAAPAEIRQAAAGGALDDTQAAALLSAFRTAFKDCRFAGIQTPVFHGAQTALHDAAVAVYKTQMAQFTGTDFTRVAAVPADPAWAAFAGLVEEMDCLGIGLADVWPGARPIPHRFYLRSAAEAQSMKTYFTSLAWSPKAPALPAGSPADALRSTTNAFEFIDFVDILVNFVPDAPMIHPRQNRPVWQVYDYDNVVNIDSWRAVQTAMVTRPAPDLKEFYAIISRRGASFDYRTERVVGGGDLDPPAACAAAGAKSWKDNTHFFVASRRQVAVLRTNPLVATQWCEDGGTGPDDGVIAQYEYPSAWTYAFPPAPRGGASGAQPARFAALLSPELRAKLDAAKAAGYLDHEFSLESTALTRAIVTELVAYILKDWTSSNNPPSYPYQLLMSTHPADDYNGRSLRSWYKTFESRRSPAADPAGVPLFLTDFNLDLFTSPEEFFEIAVVNARMWARMMAAYTDSSSNGITVQNVALPWQVAGSCDGTASPDAVITQIQAWMRPVDHLNLIRTKQSFDVSKGLAAAVASLCN